MKTKTYWMTFWDSEMIKIGKKVYECWGYAVEDEQIVGVLVEHPDGTRTYDDNKDLIAEAYNVFQILPYSSKPRKSGK